MSGQVSVSATVGSLSASSDNSTLGLRLLYFLLATTWPSCIMSGQVSVSAAVGGPSASSD
eukprot:CAMPEP_0194309190 /NCGR_PEP_ID=MMETSP0171-20130528/6171_1 /TAXON_ID=218684 /ORGANISM="Corethron pennatum, Strain L29A3" /LENGTH=59 /DNA_ID=CAMNT_0039062233 /DNA_START=59 /DNA_END=235 /DNA_ORIENTATION=-